MASQHSKAVRRAQAVERLNAARRVIAQKLDITLPPRAPAAVNRDIELAQIHETEQSADFLELIGEKLQPAEDDQDSQSERDRDDHEGRERDMELESDAFTERDVAIAEREAAIAQRDTANAALEAAYNANDALRAQISALEAKAFTESSSSGQADTGKKKRGES